MTVLSDRQLAALLRKAHVPAGDAAYLVAIAHPESSAIPDNKQPGQPYGSTGWGLWQITPGNSEPGIAIDAGLFNPQKNADAAAAKLRSQGLGAWTTYTSGKYKPYFPAAEHAVASVYQMPLSQVDKLAASAHHWTPSSSGGAGGGGGGGGGTQRAQLDSITTSAGGMVQDMGALLHGSAVVLDRVFGLFAPGNGWRIVFGAAGAAAGAGAYKAWIADSGADEAGHLPVAIGLTGIAVTAAFFALRPWPQTSAGPIKPGAYVVDVLKGEPPPAGPESFSPTEVHLTETGLAAAAGLWAAGKASSAIINIVRGIGVGAGAASALSRLFRNMAKGAEDIGGGEAPVG